jgi:hypothetical protein
MEEMDDVPSGYALVGIYGLAALSAARKMPSPPTLE